MVSRYFAVSALLITVSAGVLFAQSSGLPDNPTRCASEPNTMIYDAVFESCVEDVLIRVSDEKKYPALVLLEKMQESKYLGDVRAACASGHANAVIASSNERTPDYFPSVGVFCAAVNRKVHELGIVGGEFDLYNRISPQSTPEDIRKAVLDAAREDETRLDIAGKAIRLDTGLAHIMGYDEGRLSPDNHTSDKPISQENLGELTQDCYQQTADSRRACANDGQILGEIDESLLLIR